MRQKRRSTRLLAAALAALLVDSLAGASGLVLCLGAGGHLAIEIEHDAAGCPTLTNSKGVSGVSVQPQGECVDIPSAGTGLMTASSFEAAQVPTPPVAFVVPYPESTPRVETRNSASADARAGPPDRARHLRSTVLLV